MTEMYDCRTAWSDTLSRLAGLDPRIVAVVNDSVGSSKLSAFQEQFPDRVINVGIAEQDMVGVAAGLAAEGFVPFVSCAGSFLSARAMEQIKIDAAYSRSNIKLIAQSPGVAYGELGATHHSMEDLGWMRTIPDLAVVCPSGPRETTAVIEWAASHDGPIYIRVSRMPVPEIHESRFSFELAHATQLRNGSDVTLVATGTTVSVALQAADLLRQDRIEARVLSMPSVKPLDDAAIHCAAAETRGIVTVEEAIVTGLGGAVAEAVVHDHPVRMSLVGATDEFAPTGSTDELFRHFRITPHGVAEAARMLLV